MCPKQLSDYYEEEEEDDGNLKTTTLYRSSKRMDGQFRIIEYLHVNVKT